MRPSSFLAAMAGYEARRPPRATGGGDGTVRKAVRHEREADGARGDRGVCGGQPGDA